MEITSHNMGQEQSAPDLRFIGKQVFYKLTEKQSLDNNHQKIAPATIVAVWPNEYSQEGYHPFAPLKDPEMKVGLNLKVITDGETDIWVTSARRAKGILSWNEGEYYCPGSLT